MTEIDVAKLRSLADKATPGPWAWTGDPGDDEACLDAAGAEGYVLSASGMHTEGFVNVEAPDAEFIAATNPATIIALLDRLEQAEAAIERVRAMAEEMGEAIGFDRLVHGGEAEYPVSYFRDKLEEALEPDAALDTGKEKNDE